MIRLVSTDLFHELRPRARRFDVEAVLPQWNSLPDVLTIAAQPRYGELGWWSIHVVEPFTTTRFAWLRGVPKTLPSFGGYKLSAEKSIHWLNSLPQRYGLSVRQAILPAETWSADSIPGVEILAFALTDADLTRVWYHDRSGAPDGFAGVSPLVRAGRASKPHTSDNVLAARQLDNHYHTTAGKRLVITPKGIQWT